MQPSLPLPPRQPAWCSPSPRCTPLGSAPSSAFVSTTSIWVTINSPSRAASARWMTSPVAFSWLGWAIGAVVGRTPPIRPAHQPADCPGTGPASRRWANQMLQGHTATFERLRVDRQLEEALAHRADPLHLAVVFGLDEKTALRYASTARQLLETQIERNASS